jgi:putative iron-regulated protein
LNQRPVHEEKWPLLLLAAAWLSCTREQPPRGDLDAERTRSALVTYADIAQASYGDALLGAHALSAAIELLLREPSERTLRDARLAWQAAREPYVQSEVYRFYGGPIDEAELLLNTWPIDENYVEGTPDASDKGVIDDPARYPALERALLVSLNARDGETSISTGYHVLEFLLWGRDTSDVGPGARPATDFEVRPDDTLVTRRRRYLQLASELLVLHLEPVAAAWRASSPGNYRAHFLALPQREALGLALRGMGSLSGPELSGERLTVPYETRDQENEHSCFSDTTHEDVVHDALGLQNVCLGRYTGRSGASVRGVGLCAALAGLDAREAATLETQLGASLLAARRIPAPFDRALAGPDQAPGRTAIKQTIVALEAQTRTLATFAQKLGLRVSAPRAAQ